MSGEVLGGGSTSAGGLPTFLDKGHHQDMEQRVFHVTEAEAARDLASILQRVQEGAEVAIARNAQPVAVIRSAAPVCRTNSECIALAEAHEQETGHAPTLDPDFAADVAEIMRNRKPWNPPSRD